MKLTEKEAAILAAAELRADVPVHEIRKDSGYRDHTIRYCLQSLTRRRVITPVPFINLHRLGYTIYSLFFSLGAEKRATTSAVLRSFLAAPQVLFVGEFGGEYHYGIGFCTKRFSTLVDFLAGLSKKHGNIFFEKAISVQVSSTVFPRRYLTSRKISAQPLTVSVGKKDVEIDELDFKILSGLTKNSDLSQRQLAVKLSVPPSTLALRAKKLRDEGVIAGDIFLVDTNRFNVHSFKLLIYTKGNDATLSNSLMKFCMGHPHVTYLIDCLGSWGYELGVEVFHPQDVISIIQEIYEAFGATVNTVKILTKFRYPKAQWFPDSQFE